MLFRSMANLLTATDVGLRDHVHEAGILKAMGLTPRQVMATLVVSTTIVTAIGVVAGVVAGLVAAPRLINAQGQASGIGWGIAAGLSPATIAALVAAALAAAVAAALFLSARARDPLLAAVAPPAAALRYGRLVALRRLTAAKDGATAPCAACLVSAILGARTGGSEPPRRGRRRHDSARQGGHQPDDGA